MSEYWDFGYSFSIILAGLGQNKRAPSGPSPFFGSEKFSENSVDRP